MLYPVLIIHGNQAWHLSFPDFPDLSMMQVGTLTTLLRSARKVLQEHIDTLAGNDNPIPPPTSASELVLGEGMVLGRVNVIVPSEEEDG